MIKRKKLPNPESHKKFIVAFCDKGNVQVRFVPNLARPSASVTQHGDALLKLREPIVTDLVSPELWDWDAHHEGAHLLPELRFTYDAIRMCKNQFEASVTNVLADNICERARLGQFRGHDRILYQGRHKYTVDNIGTVMNREHPSMSALFILDFIDRGKWQGQYPVLKGMPGSDDYVNAFLPLQIFERIPEIMELQSGDMLYALTCEIINAIKEVVDQSKQDQQQDQQQQADGGSDDQQDDGSGDSSDGGDDVDSDDDGTGGSGDPDDDTDGDSATANTSDQDDNDVDSPTSESGGSGDSADPQDPDNTGDSGQSSENQGEPQDSGNNPDSQDDSGSKGRSSGTSHEMPDFNQVDLPDNVKPMEKPGTYVYEETSRGMYHPIGDVNIWKFSSDVSTRLLDQINDLTKDATISKSVQKYFKIMSKDTWTYGLKQGRIHGKNLYRLYATDTQQPKIFKQKNAHRLKTNTAVQIMIDSSGSMNSNDKYANAAACAILISGTLTDLRIPHEILGFTDVDCSIRIYPFKLYNEVYNKKRLLERFASTMRRSYTPDAEAIVLGASRLMERKEDNKLMIVLSDGTPEGNCIKDGRDGVWYLKEVCKILDDDESVELIGIGIMDNSVEQFYKNHVVISSPDQLEEVLIEALERTLI
jgi:hypothetical protein